MEFGQFRTLLSCVERTSENNRGILLRFRQGPELTSRDSVKNIEYLDLKPESSAQANPNSLQSTNSTDFALKLMAT